MTALIWILILLAIVISLVGIAGAILPALPGPPMCWIALFMLYFACPGYVTLTVLLGMLALTVVVTVLDYVAPIWLTRFGGGSKEAVWGSTIGLVAGLFFMPVGLIIGPLLGAFLGEMIHDNRDVSKSLKVAAMSFLAFLLTTGLKLIACLMMAYNSFAACYHCIFAV